MDRNTVIGFVLLGALFIGYLTIQSRISQKARVQEVMQQDSIRVAEEMRIADSLQIIKNERIAWAKAHADSTITTDSLSETELLNLYDTLSTTQPVIISEKDTTQKYTGPFAESMQGEKELIVLENDKLQITFDNKGGDIEKVELKDYKQYDGGPLYLVNGEHNYFNYTFYYDNDKLLNTDSLYFNVLENIPGKSITFRASAGEGKYFDQIYSFNDTSYLVDYKIKLTGFNNVIPANLAFLKLNWQNDMQEQEKNIKYERQYSKFYFSYKNGDLDYKSSNGNIDFDATVKWLSCQQQFFNTTLIAKNGFDNQGNMSIYSDEEDTTAFVKRCNAELFITFNNQSQFEVPMQWYFAPNKYSELKELGIGLEDIIPTGTSIFRVINRWVVIPLFNFLGGFLNNYGLIIFLMTLIIKIALTPLTYRSYLSMAKMRVLQPEIAEMKEKLKDDQAKMGQEQLKLFRKAGVNPLGGCIPTLLSMPILIALFRFFPGAIELRQQSFLWADDLSSYDDIIHWSADIPFIGSHLSIFCVLMTLSSILYMRMNMTQASGLTKEMRWVQYMMPVFFLFFLNNSPAGLTYYYFVSNMVTFGQQWGIRRFLINDETIHAQIQENKTKPVKKSKFAQRLEDAMKQQEAMRKGKKK
ncbi:MAG: membrane protein insertase YidC [Chitinophagales bacterium]|nr:membrane protein insertase YidC [Chitinophagales bacterium]